MAKALKRSKPPPGPSTLRIDLFAPGMTLMHRAGLGGLACTLKYVERAHRNGELADRQVPGGPWKDGRPPWQITPHSVTLDFGKPVAAKDYLRRLFGIAFQIRDGLIFLPGQYGRVPPSRAILVELQNAITLTFFQHGRTRKLAKKESVETYNVDGGGSQVAISFKTCSKFKHQDAWADIAAALPKGKGIEIVGPLNPGAVVRHVAFPASTRIMEPVDRALTLYFAAVGCLSLAINRGVGVLVAPDVMNLSEFVRDRPFLNPASPRDCRIASASDAALQAQVRLRARRSISDTDLPACRAVTFTPTPWASQQKSRTSIAQVETGRDAVLDLFEKALAELPPRLASKELTVNKGKARISRTEYFWSDSHIRPLIADNLAAGRPWHYNFVMLMSTPEKSRRTSFERKGLHAMMDKIAWDSPGAEAIVRAVHEAIRQRLGRIADENRGNPVAMKKRWEGERERWRLAFVGAKVADQFRGSLTDLWSRAGNNPVLREAWTEVLPLLTDTRWKSARDLALVGLASYVGRESESNSNSNTQDQGDAQ